MTSRKFTFTINNYTEEDIEKCKTLASTGAYVIVGKEIAPTTGTPHLQGFVFFKKPVRMTQVIKKLDRAHIEVSKGTIEQNITYSKKDGEFLEFGEPPMTQAEKGEKGREYWDEQFKLAASGNQSECDPELKIRYDRALDRIEAKNRPKLPPLEELTHKWYWGPTATGKSRKAREENPDAYLKGCNKWWDGYKYQDAVIIEDFDKNHHGLGHHLKIWGDHYPFPAEVKGGHMEIRPKLVIVTSNYSPEMIWGDDKSTREPIERRYRVIEFKEPPFKKRKIDCTKNGVPINMEV